MEEKDKVDAWSYRYLQDPKLSLQAKGLLAMLAEQPEGEDNIAEVAKHTAEDTVTLIKCLFELNKRGYISLDVVDGGLCFAINYRHLLTEDNGRSNG